MKTSITRILERNGWVNFQTGIIKKDGKNRTAYAIEPYPNNIRGIKPVTYNTLLEDIKRNFKSVWEGKTYCQYAPEIKKNWIAAW